MFQKSLRNPKSIFLPICLLLLGSNPLHASQLPKAPSQNANSSTHAYALVDPLKLSQKPTYLHQIMCYHISSKSEKPKKLYGDENFTGMVLYLYDGKTEWKHNRMHAGIGYIFLKKTQNLQNQPTKHHLIHKKLYEAIFSKALDSNRVVGSTFSYTTTLVSRAWKFHSLTFDPNPNHPSKSLEQLENKWVMQAVKNWIEKGESDTPITDRIALASNVPTPTAVRPSKPQSLKPKAKPTSLSTKSQPKTKAHILTKRLPLQQRPSSTSNKVHPTQRGEILVPADGNCLYTSILLGYLVPVMNDPNAFEFRIRQLIGRGKNLSFSRHAFQQSFKDPAYLRGSNFQDLVKPFLKHMQIRVGTWGGPKEMQIVADRLSINLEEHTPDPSNVHNLVGGTLITPTQGQAKLTLHLVRDNPIAEEVLDNSEDIPTQTSRLQSLTTSQSRQHYRVQCPSLPKGVPTEEKEELKPQPTSFSKKGQLKTKAHILTTQPPLQQPQAPSNPRAAIPIPKALEISMPHQQGKDQLRTYKPLVLLAGASHYIGNNDLPGVDVDMQCLLDLFQGHFQYEVRSTYDPKNAKTKTLTHDRLNQFIQSAKEVLTTEPLAYDGFLFFWVGHGGANSCITSDATENVLSFDKVCHALCTPPMANKPKVFFQIACRGTKANYRIGLKARSGPTNPAPSQASGKFYHPMQHSLTIFANAPGYVISDSQYRNDKAGTVLVQCLSRLLQDPTWRHASFTQVRKELAQKVHKETNQFEIVDNSNTLIKESIHLGITQTQLTEITDQLDQIRQKEIQQDPTIAQGLSLYVPLQAADDPIQDIQDPKTELYPLQEKINTFLSHSAPLLLLQGNAGAGKSLYGRWLEAALWEGREPNHPIPLFISLPRTYNQGNYHPEQGNLIEAALLDKGIALPTIQALQELASFIFVLDGLDEVHKQYANTPNLSLDLYERYQLHRWPKSKCIVTARSQAFTQEALRDIFPSKQGTIPQVHLAPFSDQKVHTYVQHFVQSKHAHQGWDEKTYEEALAAFPGLQEMIREPFSLGLVLKVLPKLQAECEANTRLTRAQLYAAFSEQWFENEFNRLQQSHPHQTIQNQDQARL